MKVLGLIVEYNPFHNGHLYHLEQSKQLSGADYVICVMSSNFIQRGEPAIVNKWARAKMALLSGADLVLELPVVYAMSSAEFFAYGATKILDSTGVVDTICFGSEHGSVDDLNLIADILNNEPTQYKDFLKAHLNSGLSYPSAREAALRKYLAMQELSTCNLQSIIGSSNNILGIEYLKALKKLKSNVVPLTIQRIGNAYNAEHITGSISSATSIRKLISTGDTHSEELEKLLPPSSLSVLREEFALGRFPIFPAHFENIILATLRKMDTAQIKALPYVVEGLENRIKDGADNSGSLEELVEKICTKRYTRTRVQRTLFNILTGITASEFDEFMQYGGPQYIRVLGFNEAGKHLLSQMNKSATLPVIVKTANFKHSCNRLLRRMLEIEASATDIYVLAYKNAAYRKAGQEFTSNIIRICDKGDGSRCRKNCLNTTQTLKCK